MLCEIDNKQIGMYISGLIERSYASARKFCTAYLKTSSGNEPTEDEIRNMANRLSQIKKGSKSIQIYDLPIFSKLLNVSYEQILSGGKCISSTQNRLTNYTVSQSHSKAEWIAYIEDKNKPILNPDEYGKTVLDYAITFGNYDFIKFLVEENYIWFDSRKDKDYHMTFGAGTSIQRIKFEERDNGVFIREPNMNDLQYKLATEDQLRMYIISFAADHDDVSMLEKLRAREIPELYRKVHYVFASCPDFKFHYDKNMIAHIAKSSDKVLEYFTESFEINDKFIYKDGRDRNHTFVFPYISQLLDSMIENNSTYLKTALQKMIEHNKKTMERIHSLVQLSADECGNDKFWKSEVEFYDNLNIIQLCNYYAPLGIMTNIAKTTKKSGDYEIDKLIEQLNDSYNSLKNINVNEII